MTSTELVPHGPPLSKAYFTSSYDASYYREASGIAKSHRVLRSQATNETQYDVDGSWGGAEMTSTSHTLHGKKDQTEAPLATAIKAVAPRVCSTAHVRNQSHIGNGSKEKPTRSTAQDSYGKPDLDSIDKYGVSRQRLHPGSLAVTFNPNFLRIDAPEGKPRPTTGPPAPLSPFKITRDGGLNTGAKHDATMKKLHPDAERRLKISDPVAYHSYVNQRPFMTQSKVYGDNTSVEHDSLKKYGVGDASDKAMIPMVADKRSLLNTLAGSRGVPQSASSKMGGMVSRVGSAPGLPLGGATEYRDSFINQWKLPEKPDPIRSPNTIDKNCYVHLNKHQIDFTASKALDSIRADDGSLKKDRPAGVHPTVWFKLQRAESKALQEEGDPHAHKKRSNRKGPIVHV